MMSRTGVVSATPASTTTATTALWPLPALPGALRLRALPRFGLKALYRNQRRSTVKNGTCLKIMVSPVRVRVPPLLKYLQNMGKRQRPAARSGLFDTRFDTNRLGQGILHRGGVVCHPRQHVRVGVERYGNGGVP